MVVQITLEEQRGEAEQQELPLNQPMQLPEFLAMQLRNQLDLIEPQLLARMLGITEQTLAVWRSEKIGPDYVKLGKAVFYRVEDLVEWVEKNHQRASTGGSEGELVTLPVPGVPRTSPSY